MKLILNNIRSTHNVGSLFRTADAAGVSELLLVGYTPDPIDRFGRARKDIAKTALGAEASVPWKHYGTFTAAVAALKAQGVRVVAVEQDARSAPYTTPNMYEGEIALVLGEEVKGLTHDELALVDAIVEIPMHGEKESLNVSVAAGVALFEALRQCHIRDADKRVALFAQ